MEYVLSIVSSAAQLVIYALLWDSFLARRSKRITFWAVLFIWIGVFISVPIFLPGQLQTIRPLILLIELSLLFGTNIVLFRGQWNRRMFVVVTSYASFYSIGSIVEMLWLIATHMSRVEYINNQVLYTWFLFLRLSLLGIAVAIIRRFHRYNPEVKQPSIWGPLSTIFPLCTLFVIYMTQTASEAQSVWLFCMMIMSAVDFATLFLFDHLESSAQMHEALAVARQRADVQEASIQALRDSYTAQRRMTHEFRGYLSALSELLTHGKTAEAMQLLDELKVRQTERILLVNSHHPLIDAILNQKGYTAEEHKIDIRFVVNDLSGVTIAPVDLAVVLGNLLDNAIEACEKLSEAERWITVKVIHETKVLPSTLFLSIENSSPPVDIVNDRIASTKSEPELHGFGLPNVLRTLDKAGAMHMMKCQKGSFLFCAEWPNASSCE